MSSGVIIRRKAGVFVPTDYAKRAIEANPTAWGVALVTEGELMLNKGTGLDLELFQDTQKDFEKQDITFGLVSSPSAISLEDISPFTILSNTDKEETPLLVAFIDGRFPQYEQSQSSHPAEFFVANEYLIPKLQEMFDLTGGDIAKVMEVLKKPHFKKDMLLTATPSGVITFVSATGEALTFAKTDDASEYSWGWVSRNYDYAKAPPTDRTEEVPKKKTMFPNKSTVREAAPSSAVAAVASGITADANKGITVHKWTPDKDMSRSNRKDAFKQRIGYLPEGWADREHPVTVEVYYRNGKLLTHSEFKRLGLTAVGLPVLNNPPEQNNRDNKDVQPEHVKGPERPISKAVTTEVLPLMSPATREHINKIMADTTVQKLIADNADIMSDPNKVKQLEAKFADFATQLGRKNIDDFMPWSYQMMEELAKARPDGIAVMCWTFRNMLAGKMAKEATKVEAPVVEEVAPVVQRKTMFPKKVA